MFLIAQPASHEPEDDDGEIADYEFEAMVRSADREQGSILDNEPKLETTAPAGISRAVLEDLRRWLDEHEPLDDDYAPGAAESCGFRRAHIRVEPGQIEDAFGYCGGKRYISLHWSPKVDKVFVCDGLGRWSFSEAVDTWKRFLDHPLVKPHLQTWDESEKPRRSVQIEFSALIDRLPESALFSSEQSAREMEADVKTNCLLYDRVANEIYTGNWASSALLFHSLVDDPLEEDLISGRRAEPVPLLSWLSDRQKDAEHVFGAAASNQQHGQDQDALAALRNCIEREPNSHLYWCRLSQTLGSLSRWDEALDACEKAIMFHASAPRQHLSAGYMFKWKAECLFMLHRYSEAAHAYQFVTQVDDLGDRADSYSQLARCYEKMESYREAVSARELEVRDRADSLSQALRGRESEEVEDEIVDMEQFSLGEAWLGLGRCYLLNGNVAAAEWALRRAIEVAGKCVRASVELGALLRRLGRVVEAEARLQDGLSLAIAKVDGNPELGSAHSDLAFVYRALGNSEAAEQSDQRADELGWKSSDEERRVVGMKVVDQHSVS
jgi:tetratricopeptide (TPR) repeat protein